MVSRHAMEVATQNSEKGEIAMSQHGMVVATPILRDQKMLSQRGSKWLETEMKSRHGIMVATQIPGNKKMLSQLESSLLATKHGHDAAIQVATEK